MTQHSPWGKRAYHTLVRDPNGCAVLTSGQSFLHFYNDVWVSCDAGSSWTCASPDGRNDSAIFSPRAGAAGAVAADGRLVVSGGSFSILSIIDRKFFSDVWTSGDGGHNWELVTVAAGWSPRSGPRVVAVSDPSGKQSTSLFLIGGEHGFTAADQLGDVWRSAGDDLTTWTCISSSSTWAPRSGHGVFGVSVSPRSGFPTQLLLVAGWPLLYDVWLMPSPFSSSAWEQMGSAYNCSSASCGRFDFAFANDASHVWSIAGSHAVSTFGDMLNETWVYS